MEKSSVLSLLSFIQSYDSTLYTLTQADLLPTSPSIPFELLNLYYSQSNLKENVKSSHYKQYLLPKSSSNPILKLSTFPLAEGFPFVSYSPTKTLKAVLQSFQDKKDKSKTRNTLEIYNKDSLIRSLNLDDFHDPILNNPVSGKPLIWSSNENRLLYIAELKQEKRTGFFDNYNTLDENQLAQAEENYQYEPDYGERLVNIKKMTIFVYDLKENTLNQLLIPYEKLFPMNPNFIDSEGNELIFSGFISDPVKLGLFQELTDQRKFTLRKYQNTS